MGQSLFLCFSYFDPMFCCIYTSAVDRGYDPGLIKAKTIKYGLDASLLNTQH